MNDRKRLALFFGGFAVVALILAGIVSYFASSDPDGLDAATQQGCQVVQSDQGEQLDGNCIARNAKEHSGPLADYSIGGDSRFTGVAGVVGVIATAAVGFGMFALLRRRSRSRT